MNVSKVSGSSSGKVIALEVASRELWPRQVLKNREWAVRSRSWIIQDTWFPSAPATMVTAVLPCNLLHDQRLLRTGLHEVKGTHRLSCMAFSMPVGPLDAMV